MRPDLVWEVAEPEAALKRSKCGSEGERRNGGRATRNVVNIGTHFDIGVVGVMKDSTQLD